MSYSNVGMRPGFVERVVSHTGGWQRLTSALADHLETDITIVDKEEELCAVQVQIRETLIPVLCALNPGLEFEAVPYEIKPAV